MLAAVTKTLVKREVFASEHSSDGVQGYYEWEESAQRAIHPSLGPSAMGCSVVKRELLFDAATGTYYGPVKVGQPDEYDQDQRLLNQRREDLESELEAKGFDVSEIREIL